MTFGSDGRPNKRSLSQCHGTNDPSPTCRFRFTPVGTLPLAHQDVRRDATLLHKLTPSVKNGGISLWSNCSMSMAVNTDSRALVWPRPPHNLTCVPRRPQHRLSSQASCKSWNHPLAIRLPTSRYHVPASTPKIAAETPQRGLEPHPPHHTWTLDPGPGLRLRRFTDLEPAICCQSCKLPVDHA